MKSMLGHDIFRFMSLGFFGPEGPVEGDFRKQVSCVSTVY